ncbi:hypothetical protein PVAND_016346 [Polypedilum vanderplanki]|uniref:PNPLA domain-containing protein n=1 Tax=Polypedilum vanderplanki TaxID=319348 RepID=A0A9J6BFZ8_POLVA|nr:hypothetical protein PVAND_016346 [Polypedilum vanderplanki]
MIKALKRNFLYQLSQIYYHRPFVQKRFSHNHHFDQSKFHYLINSINQNKSNPSDQVEFLQVLNKTIENDRQFMDVHVQELATNLLIDILNEQKIERCKEVDENCRLGLALLGYTPPLQTEYLRILSIDGGGIRGILVIELMRRLEELTGKRVFELFDFICGVSTGAIFVCGLASDINRTLMDGKRIYKEVSKKVFHLPSTFDMLSGTSRLMWSHAYYDVQLWEKLLKETTSEQRIIETSKSGKIPKFCCVSTTVSEDAIDAHVFRNYILPWNVESIYNGSHTAALWEVVRCSSAAPTYFGDYILNNQVHQDGGVLYNNPSCVAIHEAKLLWPNQKLCLVSIGTGRSPNKKKVDSQKLYLANDVNKMFKEELVQTSSWKTKFMRILDAATDTEQTHHILSETKDIIQTSTWKTKFLRIIESATDTEKTHRILSDLMEPGTYFRFNPYLTQMISMTECNPEKWKQLENDAMMYYRRNEHKFEELAEKLLQPRSSITTLNDMLFKRFV